MSKSQSQRYSSGGFQYHRAGRVKIGTTPSGKTYTAKREATFVPEQGTTKRKETTVGVDRPGGGVRMQKRVTTEDTSGKKRVYNSTQKTGKTPGGKDYSVIKGKAANNGPTSVHTNVRPNRFLKGKTRSKLKEQ